MSFRSDAVRSLALILALGACAQSTPAAPERWSMSGCTDGGNIYFNADGTFSETGGCSGRWSKQDNAYLIGEPCQVSILTTHPLMIMGHDEDGRLAIVAPDILEARAGGITRQVKRCA